MSFNYVGHVLQRWCVQSTRPPICSWATVTFVAFAWFLGNFPMFWPLLMRFVWDMGGPEPVSPRPLLPLFWSTWILQYLRTRAQKALTLIELNIRRILNGKKFSTVQCNRKCVRIVLLLSVRSIAILVEMIGDEGTNLHKLKQNLFKCNVKVLSRHNPKLNKSKWIYTSVYLLPGL